MLARQRLLGVDTHTSVSGHFRVRIRVRVGTRASPLTEFFFGEISCAPQVRAGK